MNLQSSIKKRFKSIMTKSYSRRTSNQGNKCYCSTQDLNCSLESLNRNGLDHLPSRKFDHMEQWSFVILNLKILTRHGSLTNKGWSNIMVELWKDWILFYTSNQDNRMMYQANDVKRVLTGRQPSFSFPFLFFILYLLHVFRIISCDCD